MNRFFLTVVAAVGFTFGAVSNASSQSNLAGPVVLKNSSSAELTITNFRYVDNLGQNRTLAGAWKIEPGFYGYLEAGKQRIVAKKITYDLVTSDGKTVNWSCESKGVDADGDFSFSFTAENLADHVKLLGRTSVVAFRPAYTPAQAGPTDEQIARGALKALGAAVLHQKAKQAPEDFADVFAVELARTGRDQLIKSAVEDLFPQIPAKDRSTLGNLVPLALDGRLTDRNLRAAVAQEAIVDYLRKQNPDFALAAQAADFLYRVQQGSR